MEEESGSFDADRELEALARAWLSGAPLPKAAFLAALSDGADPGLRLDGEPLVELAASCALALGPWVCSQLGRFGAPLGAALERACAEGGAEEVQALLGAGAQAWSASAQSAAVERADPEILGLLLEAGADGSRMRAPEGGPALAYLAAMGALGAVDCARMLLDAGADPDEPDEAGWTPLGRACRGSRSAMARLLLSRGADPRSPVAGDWSPMALALGATRDALGSVDCALALAPALGRGWGAVLDSRGEPPLARLCLSAGFEPSWMDQLARAGADPLARGADGGGLLEVACRLPEAQGLALARWALGRGADPSRGCWRHVLPEERARKAGRFELAELLRSWREKAQLEGEAGEGSGGSKSKRL